MHDQEEIVWSVAELHLDEGEFLAGSLEQEFEAEHSTLAELAAGTEARLLANVDGLVIVGAEAVERLLVPAMKEGPPARAQAAAMARLGSEHDDGLAGLWPLVLEAKDDLRVALGRALALWEAVPDALLVERLGRDGPEADSLLLDALADRGADCGVGLEPLLREPGTLRAALRAARFSSSGAALRAAELALRGQDPALLHPALLVVAPRALPAALALARTWMTTPGPLRRPAMELLATAGGVDDGARLLQALQDGAARADALWALGFQGTRAAAEVALALLGDAAVGGLAGEAFVAITGLDPVVERCLGPRPPEPDGLPPLEEDDLEADLVPTADQRLPRLSPDAVRRWWTKHQRRFPEGRRYVLGAELDPQRLRIAMEACSMRRRRVLALELAIRSRGTTLVPHRAATARQRRCLGATAGT